MRECQRPDMGEADGSSDHGDREDGEPGQHAGELVAHLVTPARATAQF